MKVKIKYRLEESVRKRVEGVLQKEMTKLFKISKKDLRAFVGNRRLNTSGFSVAELQHLLLMPEHELKMMCFSTLFTLCAAKKQQMMKGGEAK